MKFKITPKNYSIIGGGLKRSVIITKLGNYITNACIGTVIYLEDDIQINYGETKEVDFTYGGDVWVYSESIQNEKIPINSYILPKYPRFTIISNPQAKIEIQKNNIIVPNNYKGHITVTSETNQDVYLAVGTQNNIITDNNGGYHCIYPVLINKLTKPIKYGINLYVNIRDYYDKDQEVPLNKNEGYFGIINPGDTSIDILLSDADTEIYLKAKKSGRQGIYIKDLKFLKAQSTEEEIDDFNYHT